MSARRSAKALAEHGLSRIEALVAVGRASIELRFLSTPPAPEEELPDLVRFQAVRQFTTLGDDWPLDFVPLSPNADGGINVLAAAISPDLRRADSQDCTAARHHRLAAGAAAVCRRVAAQGAARRRQVPDDRRSAAGRRRPDGAASARR